MVRLILLGLLAGAFFSSTFILNEMMSTAGGHWFWSASLRYLFMWLIITAIILIQQGAASLKALMTVFWQHWRFWCVTGSIGFGLFYTGICYAADHVAGWVVAATFMFTVVTSLLVLMAFGQRFARRFIGYALLVFIGVVLVNVSEGIQAATVANTDIANVVPMADMLLYGALPALIAAFSYPIGNQLVWQVTHNSRAQPETTPQVDKTPSPNGTYDEPLISEAYDLPSSLNDATINSEGTDNQSQLTVTSLPSTLQAFIDRIPTIETTLLHNAFNKVWLMTLGSLPFWLLLGMIMRPEAPEISQLFNTLLVALLAGVAATTIFLYARGQAATSSEVAGVDATQASEVVFALIGGILLLDNSIPSTMGLVGIALIIIGLILFAKDG
ncbi:multidrug resistance efflux transporter family protein [Psychrobacter sp. F1192]|uniref:Multidrug resistance efflux transporter family protein n=1 Tax=Psychrobacter coccoides TaxID=2818440 RepID=A0ABS3NKW0_9GAMM|nr:multidrug resistance efflux transporter family protein [Psychrobacter coccoides]MBO1529861.1 multidrug resistance efflux transporter family protein [Psychrobacter coccoides]